tara:strand:+ start:530 stop:916 length:387 start_codon:yes stop_codon:yes gene_type:complete
MDIITILKIITALGIFNVWILRYNKATEFRGGQAQNLKEEFETYGLKLWSMFIIGGIKISISILFIAGLFTQKLTLLNYSDLYGAGIMSIIMIGAILMHLKVNDPMKKSIPAITMLTMYSIIFLNYFL